MNTGARQEAAAAATCRHTRLIDRTRFDDAAPRIVCQDCGASVSHDVSTRHTAVTRQAAHELAKDRAELRALASRAAMVSAAVVLAAWLLAGCGGGDPEPDVLLPTVSCTAGVCK